MKRHPTDIFDSGNDYCFGKNSVRSALTSSPMLCTKVLLADSLFGRERNELLAICKEAGVTWQAVKVSLLDDLCPSGRHQGIAAKMSPVIIHDFEDFKGLFSEKGKPALLLLLDHVQDPQNLGVIARSAEVFGAGAVIVPKRRSALPTSTVMRTSAGAIARIPVIGVVNVARTLGELKEYNYWIVGLHHEARDILGDSPLPERTVLVTGSEDKGLSRLTLKSCDLLLRIPMDGMTGSLNAATAAAIGMYEWRKVVDNADVHG